VQRAYLDFCRKLARVGVVRAPQEGARWVPVTFAQGADGLRIRRAGQSWAIPQSLRDLPGSVGVGLGVVTLALLMQTGTLGGEISHPEIRAADAPEVTVPPEGQEGLGKTLQSWVNTIWAFPSWETLHFTGLALLIGVTLLINFRLLGLLDGLTFSSVHRFLPLGILGFGITMISGMLMFNSDIPRYAELIAFFLKMVMTMVAGISVLYVTIFDDAWALGEGDGTALRHKIFAVTTTLLWMGVMYIGRMLPALGSGN